MWSMQTSTNIQYTPPKLKQKLDDENEEEKQARSGKTFTLYLATRHTNRHAPSSKQKKQKRIKPVVWFTFGWKFFGIYFLGNGKLLHVGNDIFHTLSHRSHYSIRCYAWCAYLVCINILRTMICVWMRHFFASSRFALPHPFQFRALLFAER